MGDNTATEDLLWDVMEEHFDEAQYACEEFEVQLSHATLSLELVEENIEARLAAHVDGLVLGGDAVAQRLLAATFEADDRPDRARTVAAAFALMRGGKHKLAATALLQPDAELRQAALRGISLAGAQPLEAWALDRFRESADPDVRATLLPLTAARLEPATILGCLQSDAQPGLVAAAARAVAWGSPGIYSACMEALIEHEDAEVRRVALRASLAWGSARAWANCTKQAFSGDAQHSESIALFASLSTHKQSAQLIELLEREELKATVLFALGFSGNRDVVPVLIEHLSGDDRSIAKLAAQSIQIITGLDTQADEYALPIPEPGDPIELPPPNQDPDAQASLPPIDQDDLDANLVPIPEDAMPDPDAEAIRRYWEKAQSGFSPSQRYLLGQPVSVSSLLDALERARMRVRHVLAQQLGIRTGGQCWLDTTMLISDQRARLAELRGLQVRSFARQFGYT